MNVDEVYAFYKSTGVIILQIRNFNQFVQLAGSAWVNVRRLSKLIYLRGLPWKILFTLREYRDGNGQLVKKLGFFLQCNAKYQNSNWSCHASAILKVLAQKEGKEDRCREIKHTFNAEKDDWGFAKFMPLEELMDPENGWYDPTTDSITLSAEINADIPLGLEIIPLKIFCEINVATLLNNENACELLALANQLSAKHLKANALKFIQENANEVTQTEGWKMLEQGIYGGELYNEIVKIINDAKEK